MPVSAYCGARPPAGASRSDGSVDPRGSDAKKPCLAGRPVWPYRLLVMYWGLIAMLAGLLLVIFSALVRSSVTVPECGSRVGASIMIALLGAAAVAIGLGWVIFAVTAP
jgi:hypothetical protein